MGLAVLSPSAWVWAQLPALYAARELMQPSINITGARHLGVRVCVLLKQADFCPGWMKFNHECK